MSETTEEKENVTPEAEAVDVEATEAERPEADAAPEVPEDEPQPEPDPIAVAQADLEEAKNQLLRARAEFDNYRKRMAKEMEQLRKTAAADLIRDLLPVVDNLERGLEHADQDSPLAQGMDAVMRQFAKTLSDRGLEPVAGVGEPFDPNVHEALAQQPSEEYDADVVVQVYERGYKLGDQVLRHAKVIVSSGNPAEADASAEDAEDNSAKQDS